MLAAEPTASASTLTPNFTGMKFVFRHQKNSKHLLTYIESILLGIVNSEGTTRDFERVDVVPSSHGLSLSPSQSISRSFPG